MSCNGWLYRVRVGRDVVCEADGLAELAGQLAALDDGERPRASVELRGGRRIERGTLRDVAEATIDYAEGGSVRWGYGRILYVDRGTEDGRYDDIDATVAQRDETGRPAERYHSLDDLLARDLYPSQGNLEFGR